MFVTFDVEIRRDVVADQTCWVQEDEASEEGLGGNRNYTDTRGFGWEDVPHVLESERLLLLKLEPNPLNKEVWAEIEHEEEEIFLTGPWPHMDLGVNAIVAALCAARCVTFSSCNGGCCGDHHHESHPLVALYALPPWIPLLLECAVESGAGIENGENGCVVIYANDIWKMLDFAQALLSRKTQFDALDVQAALVPPSDPDQLNLFD